MPPRKNIGVRVDDLRMDVKRGLRFVADMRFTAVELSADREEVSPDALSESGRRHLARSVTSTGMAFSSLAIEGRGGGLADPALVDSLVTQGCRTLRLAADMGVPIVSHNVGELLDLPDQDKTNVTEALLALGDEAEKVGGVLAIRSRVYDPADLDQLIRTIGCESIRVGVDPGMLLMSGMDPIEVLNTHGDRIVLAYVRDAQRGTPRYAGRETALGAGRLDLDQYLAGLAACGYATAPILRRGDSLDAAADVAADKEYLESRLLL
jgi:sugar phosphate isomerase/epimerase